MMLWVALAGGVGSVARFVTDGLIRTAVGRKFPWGTLMINVLGSFILGLLAGRVFYHHNGLEMKLILGTGFCGDYTTFGTASFETVRLLEEKRYVNAVMNVGGTLVLAVLAAAAGFALVR